MYKKILIAVAPDHPETIAELVRVARALAAPDAEIEALSVVSAVPTYLEVSIPESVYEDACSEVKRKLEEDLSGEEDVTKTVRIGNPSGAIDAYQKDGNHDLIVLRSHSPGIQDFFLGSTAGRIVRHAPCSVHVIR